MTSHLYRRLVLALLFPLLVVLPVAHTTGLRNTLAGLLTVAVLGQAVIRRQWIGPSPWPLAWFALCLGSAAWSVNPGYSLGDALTSVLLPLGCAWAAFSCIEKRDVVPVLVVPLGLGMIAALAVRFVYLGIDPATPWAEGLYQYWPGRGVMSTLAILCLPLAAWLIASGERCWGVALLILAAVAGAQNWNRMFWVASFVTLLVTLPMFRLPRRTLVAIVLAGGLVVAAGGYYAARQIKQADTPGQVVSETVKTDVRWVLWQDWGRVAVETPLAGHGYGLRTTHQVGEPRLPQWMAIGIFHPHNLFLSIFFQTGALGVLLFVVTLADLLRRFYRWGRTGLAARQAALGGAALIVALVAKNMTDDFFYFAVAILFWLLIGCFAKLASTADGEA